MNKPIPKLTEKQLKRFWAKVDKNGVCWLWTGAKAKGYGIFLEEKFYAHRISYFLANGIDPGESISSRLYCLEETMNDELTRLRAICGALLEYDGHINQAAIEEMDAETCPECWGDAEDEENLAQEALTQAVLLARKEHQ